MTRSLALSTSFDVIDSRLKQLLPDEDMRQSAWEVLLAQDEQELPDEVLRTVCSMVRRKVTSQRISEQYRVKSLDAPLQTDGDDGGKPLTLHDVLPAKEPDVSTNRPRKLKLGSCIFFDREATAEMRRRYPGVPIRQALRNLLGLPSTRSIHYWQPSEDEIIRKHYPTGGAVVVSSLIDRTRVAITQRARFLGVGLKEFRPFPDWYNGEEVAKVLRCSRGEVTWLVERGQLVPTQRYRVRRTAFLFFSKEAIVRYLQLHPFTYAHEDLDPEWQQYVPAWVWEWKRIKDAAAELNLSTSTITGYKFQGVINSYRKGFRHHRYVRMDEVRAARDRPPKSRSKQPYPTVYHSKQSHYLDHEDENGRWGYFWCRKSVAHYHKTYKRRRGRPTCKVCLLAYERHQRNANETEG